MMSFTVGSSFFSKCLKPDLVSRNWVNYGEDALRFSDNCIWIGCGEVAVLRTECLSSTVKVLRENPKG